ncbi:GIY-YIG nuclease family protein [Candidatus Woesebacteria bacterium]|nr:MAG: GIY-YIG nuclease family protein [Candidatus Woesebacteria bacterium]
MLVNAKYIIKKKSFLKSLPTTPGVYFFQDKDGKIRYIGKAKNLYNRVSTYFLGSIEGKTKIMVGGSYKISYIEVASELEALLLEAKLVRKYKPQYNFELRDDKNPLYIKITKEKYPRVLTARKIDESEHLISFYGPFPSGENVRVILRLLKRVFPFSNHVLEKRACLDSQIGLCNPCPNDINIQNDIKLIKELTRKYTTNIRLIKKVLDGNIDKVRNELEKTMKVFADKEMYEEAFKVKEVLDKLEYITQPIINIDKYLINPNFIEDIRRQEGESLNNILQENGVSIDKLHRIECFDVAHISGVNATASMVTFIDGVSEKKLYRHFKIRQDKKTSDTDSMKEIARRRKARLRDWGTPDLIVVDGGKGQVSVFCDVFSDTKIQIVGLAKRYETLVIKNTQKPAQYNLVKLPKGPALNLLQRLRDEAHRFARRYHHLLVAHDIHK